jgi:hypothetical protein
MAAAEKHDGLKIVSPFSGRSRYFPSFSTLLVLPDNQRYDAERQCQKAEKRFRDDQLCFIRG